MSSMVINATARPLGSREIIVKYLSTNVIRHHVRIMQRVRISSTTISAIVTLVMMERIARTILTNALRIHVRIMVSASSAQI